ncbi:MAG: hypothetical protein ACJ798_16145 [Phenylobacterium sp.]
MNWAGIVLGALLLQTGGAAHGAGPWIVTCDVGAQAPRIFRLGPKLFQEWKPAQASFGSNLCLSFPCHGDGHRLEGAISSATLILTITLDLDNGAGAWRAVGASGLSRTQGACSVGADTVPAHNPTRSPS